MMPVDLRRVLGFGLRFVPIFLLLLAAYLATISWLPAGPQAAANLVMQRLDPPTRLERLPAGGWRAWAEGRPGQERVFVRWEPFVVHLLFLNMVLVPALVLATPASLAARLRLVGWAIPLILVVQTLALIGLVRGQLCLVSSPGSFLCLWQLRLVYASGQLSAALLWAGLTWRYWLPPGEAATGSGAAPEGGSSGLPPRTPTGRTGRSG